MSKSEEEIVEKEISQEESAKTEEATIAFFNKLNYEFSNRENINKIVFRIKTRETRTKNRQ